MKLYGRVDGVETEIAGGGGGDSIQVDVLPTASASNLGKIYQYVGETTASLSLINGYFYKCVYGDEYGMPGRYIWINIDVQGGGVTGDGGIYYDVLPPHNYLYGFDINTLDSNPYTRVTYPMDVDNKYYSPAYMDFDNDFFRWGSWGITPGTKFMPRPCMLNFDTTVAYYLDPSDYTKKADGTASDVKNVNANMNAMMEWPKIYTFRSIDSHGIYRFRCSDVKLGSKWECWCNYDVNNNIIPNFYTPIYSVGDVISNKLRSISNRSSGSGGYFTACLSYADNVGNSNVYSVETIGDRLLINDLLILISKNTNTQLTFGLGKTKDSSTGEADNKGLFWGSLDADNYHTVKVFGMENYWGGSRSRWIAGLIGGTDSDPYVRCKITRGTKDGSTVSNYNSTGEGYLKLRGFTAGNLSGYNYIDSTLVTNYGRFPIGNSGSSGTYETDAMRNGSRIERTVCVVGHNGKFEDGAFFIDLYYYNNSNNVAAGLSCKPLAPTTDVNSDVDS